MSEVCRPHRGWVLVPARCCSGERFRDYPRQTLGPTLDTEWRLSLDCWTFICSYMLIISNLLHSAVIQQPFEYFQWGPTQWIELIMCLSFVWTSGDWCSGLWLNNISPAFLILATMQQWPVPCQCAILPILKGIFDQQLYQTQLDMCLSSIVVSSKRQNILLHRLLGCARVHQIKIVASTRWR